MTAVIVIEIDDRPDRFTEFVADVRAFLSTRDEGYLGAHVALDVIADQILAIFEDTAYRPDLAAAGSAYARARDAAETARDRLAEAIRTAGPTMSQLEIVRATGVSRVTVRKALHEVQP